MPSNHVYITSLGHFLPGSPIGNDDMEDYLGRIHGKPSRFKNKILQNNGIKQRYYAINKKQETVHQNSEMAAEAIRETLNRSAVRASEIDFLAAATSQGDLALPGFASQVHAASGVPACEVATYHGVCSSGMMALKGAYHQVSDGHKRNALACASEFPSRLFKASRYEAQGADSLPLDVEFLRWMLSDGAGAVLMQSKPAEQGLSLRVEWITLRSHANDHPVCMYAGVNKTRDHKLSASWLDFPSFEAASQEGALNLKQDVRLLDDMVKLGVKEYFQLIDEGRFTPADIDWFVCHYSSEIFKGQILDLMIQGGGAITEERWFSNLATKGNTGCASIYIMLEELFHSGKLREGQRLLCMVPESGRFITSFMLLTVVGHQREASVNLGEEISAPELHIQESPHSEWLVRQFTKVWVDFETELRQIEVVTKILSGNLKLEDYKLLLRDLRQQVIDGSQWIARAASNIDIELFELRSAYLRHAATEHKDYQILERNYVAVGGNREELIDGKKNIGSEALSAWMFQQASKPNPVDLLGAMFIIEGLGKRIAGNWGRLIQAQLHLAENQVDFFTYHGVADANHFKGLEEALNHPAMTRFIAERIVKTAKVTASLYAMQLRELGNY